MKKDSFLHSKKIWILLTLELLIGVLLIGTVTDSALKGDLTVQQKKADANAAIYSERIAEDVHSGIYITDSLEQVIISEDGTCNHFYEIAENLMNDSIQSIQLAPGGTVTQIYPEEGNEAGKIDLLADPARGPYARYGMEHDVIVSQGPFDLKQGGKGIAVRNPVYLKKNGQKEFWGFTVVIIRVPDIFSNSMKALETFGYWCSLSKTAAPWGQEYVQVYSSGGTLVQPVLYQFTIWGDTWQLEVAPQNGWGNRELLLSVLCGGIAILLLLTGLTVAVLVLDERRKHLRMLAETDGLTGIYNRSGFDRTLDQWMEKHPDDHFVIAELDIDNFKFINDMYGHAAGDQALKSLVSHLRKDLPQDAVIGRNGGDEFTILLCGQTCETAHGELEAFTDSSKEFYHKGETRSFTISLGYAEYPVHATSREALMRCADAALYEVKLKGKQGCMVYQNGFRQIRKQMGFALKDISENLPGAFLIYSADPEKDELLFANQEMLSLAGCESLDDFFAYTHRSFRNLINGPEQKAVEESIWKQIHANGGQTNDYVSFSLVRKDGSLEKVLDHGRIVDSTHYGRVFYVLLISKKTIDSHYEKG